MMLELHHENDTHQIAGKVQIAILPSLVVVVMSWEGYFNLANKTYICTRLEHSNNSNSVVSKALDKIQLK